MKAQIITVVLLLVAGSLSSFNLLATQQLINGTQGVYLNTITMPKTVENIHVVKLSSDKHASQFVVFVRKFVPAHKHLNHSESVYVISGSGKFTLDGKTMDIAAGHFVYIPQGAVHSVVTTSKEPLKVLSIQAPEFFGKDRVLVN